MIMRSSGPVVRPYGDTTGDGRVQLSFTLPVPTSGAGERARAEAAALQLAAKMGMDQAMVVHAKAMGPDFTFFIIYGRVSHLVDLSTITVTEREFPLLSPQEVNLRIRTALGRKLVVVGACVGTDAHTVGIDAILNVKGHAGEKGLEHYREIRVVNLGAQVNVRDLADRARHEHADAVLVSQVVTQRDAHLAGARALAEAFAQPSGPRGPGAAAQRPQEKHPTLAARNPAARNPAARNPAARNPAARNPAAQNPAAQNHPSTDAALRSDPAQPSGPRGQGAAGPPRNPQPDVAGRDGRPLLVVGGPRFDPAMAGDLGVDRIFGRGTTPGEVASYLVHALTGPGPRDAARPGSVQWESEPPGPVQSGSAPPESAP
jgi:beta-lysine 5,6-aminomutase beta subunit